MRLRDKGWSQARIAAQLGLTKSTVAYHFRTLGSPPDARFARRYDWAAVQAAYDEGLGMRECAARFGFSAATWFQAITRGDIRPRPRARPLEELLVAERPQTSRSHLKQRLIDAGIKENRCEACGITDWLGEPLNMALHHINGIGKDNRLENLRILCPNCHAQTPNYGGRNGHRRRRAA